MKGASLGPSCRRLTASFTSASALILFAATSGVAGEDGGTRSVFAFGAGNRALAMGGAYAALAQDASAPAWNPGGLGWVERRQFLASHASLYGIDISEEYASLVIPSWRWGAGAVTFRRFSVEGMDQRDDRGVLLDPDMGLGETEAALSYGHSLGERWAVGGSLKLRQESLAGFKANGVGLDLGLLTRPALLVGHEVPWAHRFTWGMALINVVEPSLRLNQSTVSDPMSFRSGVAYEIPWGEGRRMITALDLEKARGSSLDSHLGVELALCTMLSLRGGWNDGTPTAGVGIHWRQISVDYVAESNELDTIHRFGLGLSFGPTVEESRQEALRMQEEEFRRRLASSFALREAERVRETLQRARILVDEGQFDGALQTLATARALSPDDTEGAELEALCFRGKAEDSENAGDFVEAAILYGRTLAILPADSLAAEGVARCRAQSEQLAARSARIQQLFDSALDSFSGGDLMTAREALARILEVEPRDAEAMAMMRRTQSAIEARVSDFLSQAARFVERGLFDVAADLMEQARALDPQSTRLAALSSRWEEVQESAAAAAATRTEAPRTPAGAAEEGPRGAEPVHGRDLLSDERQREIGDLYQRGKQAMDAGRADEALRYWEMVWMADPDYESVADFLKREYLLRGLEFFSRGTLDEAVRLWERALEVDPDDQKTLGYLERAREQLARTRELLGRAD